MKALINNITFSVLIGAAVTAQAQQQSSAELTCRAKAKEAAAQTYSGCVTEARNTQIDQIRKDYQKQLSDLKAKYDRELKKVGGKTVTSAPAPSAAAAKSPMTTAVSSGPAPRATKGIAKSLPTRKEAKQAAPIAQDVQTDKVVVTPNSNAPGVENQPTQNDANGEMKMQLVPAPASSDNNTASTEDQTY
jgi:hypothetical protein